jgi:hypothetical protein
VGALQAFQRDLGLLQNRLRQQQSRGGATLGTTISGVRIVHYIFPVFPAAEFLDRLTAFAAPQTSISMLRGESPAPGLGLVEAFVCALAAPRRLRSWYETPP